MSCGSIHLGHVAVLRRYTWLRLRHVAVLICYSWLLLHHVAVLKNDAILLNYCTLVSRVYMILIASLVVNQLYRVF